MNEYNQIKSILTGQWHDVLAMYGINVPKFRGKNSANGPCPCCGGKDRAHWREVEGRLALFCRSCAADKMKSPEDVITEVCNIGFGELVNNLADFANYQTPEKIQKAKLSAASKPNRNLPVDHKQDHDKSMSFLESCELSESFKVLLRHGVQCPFALPVKAGLPLFPMRNELGAVVNVACFGDKGVTFLAGGVSYGAWFELPVHEMRNSEGIAWTDCIVKGLHQWWKTGQETRVTFHEFNILWMSNVGIIKKENTIL